MTDKIPKYLINYTSLIFWPNGKNRYFENQSFKTTELVYTSFESCIFKTWYFCVYSELICKPIACCAIPVSLVLFPSLGQ